MSADALDSAVVESLLESVGGDKEFLKELFDAYAEESPGLLEAIESAAGSGDHERLRHAAHTLKSTSASLGATGVSELSRELEASGKDEVAPRAAAIADLRPMLEAALGAMQAMVQES
jgi:HPt (histidine-containing phosphotransfer) domain-containing protein